MKNSNLSLLARCFLVLTLGFTAGCGGSQLPISAPPGAIPQAPARTIVQHIRGALSDQVLYSFRGGVDGTEPQASLINVNGTLYGTTFFGGAYGSTRRDGTVFSITTAGKEHVLHSFGNGSDGAYPYASLINVKGTLYGTTSGGGSTSCNPSGCGTVFSITTDGTEHVLHNFGGDSDGQNPQANLINVNGTLYGTTYVGGTDCMPSEQCGTVFSITTGGTEHVLHSFGEKTDGAGPEAGLINVKGTLYGTTFGGGGHGEGTVFSITPSGTEKVLHVFNGPPDGAYPVASLINVNGTLYGTTSGGGAVMVERYDLQHHDGRHRARAAQLRQRIRWRTPSGPDQCEWHALRHDIWVGEQYDGSVFSITTGGTEKVLHVFSGPPDGASPYGLINVKGTLYGTTDYGGHAGCQPKLNQNLGCGTIFKIAL